MSDLSDRFDDVAEPQFDTPPLFADQDERRMHVRAYNYWASLLRGREFPSVTDLDPASLDDFGPHSVLLDFTKDKENPRLRFIGKALREECGLSTADLKIDQVPSRSLISRLTDHFFEIIANRAPIGFEAEFVSQRGNNTMYRGILMPLSADGRSIDYIYGVINWKELADPEFEAQLALEAGQTLQPVPVDAVSAAVAPTSEPQGDDTASFELPADAGLFDRLAVARDAAEAASSADGRSRGALYAALGITYDFYLASLDDAEAYAEILEDAGLTAQQRAPLTPVAKLVFGAGYDKARLTEFVAALSHGVRCNVAFGGFAEFIAANDGLKGLVRAEREARRLDKQAPKVDRAESARVQLRAAPAIAHVACATAEEFVLLVARRSSGDTVEVVGSVPHAQNLLDSALRRLKK
jgi:hypothetical protein